ncbi:UNVERIFIED_CONTAM: Phytochrome A [Sesamum calycinum]|uniref:Phytochrome A n=1 Tax=Sesamum calycinum TaxID=2727403 RepID=A0AAW2MCR2_9LAMI
MTKLSGWNREDVISNMLIGEVFGNHAACRRLESEKTFVNLGVALNNAVNDQDYKKIPFGFSREAGIMMKSVRKDVMIVDDFALNLSTETFYGDGLRLQQVLATFLLVSVNATLSGGQLGLAAKTDNIVRSSVMLIDHKFHVLHNYFLLNIL